MVRPPGFGPGLEALREAWGASVLDQTRPRPRDKRRKVCYNYMHYGHRRDNVNYPKHTAGIHKLALGRYVSNGELMRVIAPFDPWKGIFCTCPLKYSLSPYTGCAHACRYCYITSYIPDGFRSRPKERFLERLQKDLGKLNPQIPISIANSSDPYTPPEEQSQLTRRALEILLKRGFKVQLITKSDLVARDADIIAAGSCSVSFTVTTLDKEVSRRLEPGAPPPSRRLEALRQLTKQGVPCSTRLDPIIPFLNDCDLEDVVRGFANAGASHVTASTYKARPDSFNRITTSFPDLAEKLADLYWMRGEAIGRVRYLPGEVRKNIINTVKTIARDYGLTFGVCREGIAESRTRVRCDGTHLIPLRGSFRS